MKGAGKWSGSEMQGWKVKVKDSIAVKGAGKWSGSEMQGWKVKVS